MRVAPALALVVSVSATPPSSSDELEPLLTSTIRTATTRSALESAATAAFERLEHAECRSVLSDFRDASGSTLQENLDRLGQTPRGYIALILFRDGGVTPRCQNSNTLAVTSIGGREIYICGRQFWLRYRLEPRHVEALIIHELMHTLGLRENPPSSFEITERVLKRCW